MIIFFSILLLKIPLKPVDIFDPVPASYGYLQEPTRITTDMRGYYHLLDAGAQKIFVWTSSGTFFTSYGNEGQGPGEFSFSSPGVAHLGFVSGNVVVCDGIKNTLTYFHEGQYANTKKLDIAGRIVQMHTTAIGRYLFLTEDYTSFPTTVSLTLYDTALVPLKVLYRGTHDRFKPLMEQETHVGWTLRAFHPVPYVFADSNDSDIIFGPNTDQTFHIFDQSGNKGASVSWRLPRREVTEKDRHEFKQLPRFKGTARRRVLFPDVHPAYLRIYPLPEKQYLVLNISPVYRFLTGAVLTNTGEILGTINQALGENGILLSTAGQLILFTTDEEGTFTVAHVQPDLKKISSDN